MIKPAERIAAGDPISVILKKCLPGLSRRVRPRTMYFETVDWATSNPSISSSPWIRDASNSRFSLLSVGSAHAGYDRSSDALLYFETSNAKTL